MLLYSGMTSGIEWKSWFHNDLDFGDWSLPKLLYLCTYRFSFFSLKCSPDDTAWDGGEATLLSDYLWLWYELKHSCWVSFCHSYASCDLAMPWQLLFPACVLVNLSDLWKSKVPFNWHIGMLAAYLVINKYCVDMVDCELRNCNSWILVYVALCL